MRESKRVDTDKKKLSDNEEEEHIFFLSWVYSPLPLNILTSILISVMLRFSELES